jgi:hypothetical protein
MRYVIGLSVFLLLFGCGQSPTGDQIDSGLIAWYRGEENTNDELGSHNGRESGWMVNGVPQQVSYVDGVRGKAFSLNGRAGIIVDDPDSSFQFTNNDDFSFNLWIHPGAQGYWAGVLLKGQDDWDWGLWMNESGTLLNNNAGSGITPAIETWINVTVTHTASDGLWRMYANDSLISTVSRNVAQSTYPLTIGCNYRPNTNGGEFDNPLIGAIDEVRIYNRVLTSEEIAELSAP